MVARLLPDFGHGAAGVSFRDVRSSIAQPGALLFNRGVPVPCAGCPVQPLGGLGGGRDSLVLRDLDGDREPEVVLPAFGMFGFRRGSFVEVMCPFPGRIRADAHRLLASDGRAQSWPNSAIRAVDAGNTDSGYPRLIRAV